MSDIFNTKNVVNYFFWSLLLFLGLTAEAAVYSTIFRPLVKPNQATFTIVKSDNAPSITQCAMKCVSEELACYSYNITLQRCDMGKCQASVTSTGTSEDLHVACNTKAGFKLLTSGSVTACAWGSAVQVNYTTARDECQAKAAYLYTVKNLDKFKILEKSFAGKSFWVGLNDMEVEGVYRWDDDNSIIDASLVPQIFAPDEPNDGLRSEDCAQLEPSGKLYDIPCLADVSYICEQPFFNFP